MNIETEIISATTAVISLVVGALATLAASRSADSARAAQRFSEQAAKRLQLFAVAHTASDTLVEHQRVRARVEQAAIAYDTLGAFSRSYQNAGIEECKKNAAANADRARVLAEYAELFADGAQKLSEAPSEELDRVQVKLAAALSEIRALREELDREVATVDARNAQHRERALSR